MNNRRIGTLFSITKHNYGSLQGKLKIWQIQNSFKKYLKSHSNCGINCRKKSVGNWIFFFFSMAFVWPMLFGYLPWIFPLCLIHLPPAQFNSTASQFVLSALAITIIFLSFIPLPALHLPSIFYPPPWKANYMVLYVLLYLVYKTETEREVAHELCITVLVQYLEH